MEQFLNKEIEKFISCLINCIKMKKLSYLIIASVFALCSGAFISCTDDDEDATLEINFANNETSATLKEGATQYEMNATIISSEGLSEVKVFKVFDGGSDQIGEAITKFDNKNSYNFKQTFNVYEKTVIEITATDKTNKTTKRTFTINITAAPQGAAVNIWTNRLLGAQLNNTDGSSCVSATGVVYTRDNAIKNSASVDFVYYYSDGRKNALESPSYTSVEFVKNFETKNQTKFTAALNITKAEYDAISETSDNGSIDQFVTSDALTMDYAGNLAKGQYIGFKTAAGKTGIVEIGTITGTNTGTMIISIKVKK